MGGAWDQITVADLNQPSSLSFALGVLVPWTRTNHMYSVTITIQDEDSHPIGKADATFTVGRPPMAQPAPQRVLLAVPSAPVVYPHYGTYVVTASIPSL